MRSADDIRAMLKAGADKISLNSRGRARPVAHHAHEPHLRRRSASSSPSTRAGLPAAGTAGRSSSTAAASTPSSTPSSGRARPSGSGAGEILLTSMDCDGTKDGFDIPLTRAITRELNIPVIASGGAGKLEHFAEAVVEADADAVLAASVFHFGTYTVRQVKEAMAGAGVPVRIVALDDGMPSQ